MILNVRLYDTLRRELKVSDEAAKEIIVGMEEVAEEVHKKCEQKVEFLTKDIQALADRIDLRFDYIEKTFATKSDLKDIKGDLMKWILGAWVAQLAAIATVLVLLKH